MADLDDFFAKKDKKKSKVKKFTTADDLVKKLEDTSKKLDTKPKTRAPGNEEEFSSQDREDEWKDFEEERKDYSGLKLGQLTLSEEEHNVDGEQGSEAQHDTEGNAEASDRKTGPWKAVKEGAAPPPPPKEVVTQPAEPKIYRPPALQSALAKVKLREMGSRVAPDISSEEYFPSLGAAPPKPEAPKKKLDPGFEEVKHGSRSARPSEVAKSSPVTIGNRFHSLAGDAS
ncbi:protein CDV3 homolog [Phlebotomus argentipes]|uniref:protein CDV3 homolog n=1 Tax=Phlebotomus argentipes TaxID=94469 RepID=UPI002892E0EC|nr:protein CDV3 homolog [Phlebotomus argentipes]